MPWYDPDPYHPHPRLRRLATERPEIAWLCWLPPHERRWYTTPERLPLLLKRYPQVQDEEWLTILN